MEALYLFQPGNLKYDQAANHCCAFFIDEKGRAQGVAKSTAAVWCDVSWKEICTIYTHTCWSKKSAPIDSTRKSQLDHVHSWLPGSCSGRYSSTCPSSSKVGVWMMIVSEAHPYGYMLLSYWLAVKVASAFSLVGHQIGWIKYGLD